MLQLKSLIHLLQGLRGKSSSSGRIGFHLDSICGETDIRYRDRRKRLGLNDYNQITVCKFKCNMKGVLKSFTNPVPIQNNFAGPTRRKIRVESEIDRSTGIEDRRQRLCIDEIVIVMDCCSSLE
jgi:hypothetical protein